MKKLTLFHFRAIGIFVFLLTANGLYAHVKWFSEYSYEDEPLQLTDLGTTTFWILTIASMIVIGLLVYLDKAIKQSEWYKRITSWLSKYQDKSLLIMRIAVGVVLLSAWQLDKLIMPELDIDIDALRWFQLLLAVFLLFRKTVPLAGAGLIILYIISINTFGLFHMLDYFVLVGVAYYFLTSNAKQESIRNSGLTALYISIGFSLCWAGMEKLVYPEWGIALLEQNPILTMGLDEKLFIQGAAFIEISVGVMFMFSYFQRWLGLVVTLLFIMTTLVFGSTEITGHLVLHAALIIFVIEGSGKAYKTLPLFYRKIGRTPVLAGVGFAILLFTFVIAYTWGANYKYEEAKQLSLEEHPHSIEISDPTEAPQLDINITKDKDEGWNLELQTTNFKLQNPTTIVENESPNKNGYAVLSIDGEIKARIYNTWYYLTPMDPGTYNVEVELVSSLENERYTHMGQAIKAKIIHVVE